MSLPTAPCTHCRARIVYGQRSCPACGTRFDYGPTPPPEPTPAQVQEALVAAAMQERMAVSVPDGAPVGDAGFVDRGRYDEVSTVPVVPEAIPGFVDSTLFKAFTPDVVETETVEGLEASFGASTRPRPARKRVEDEEGPKPCRDCGTVHERAVCPACGARR